ncbi:MAG: hypothetical protein ABR521_00055 [Gaiellaceae bacterium]
MKEDMLTSEQRRDAESAIARLIYTYCHRLDGADLAGAAALFERARWQLSPDVICNGAGSISLPSRSFVSTATGSAPGIW